MANEPILRGLNPEQRRAVRHGGGDATAAPLRIIAGAGSGKTKCLAHRVAHLVLKGADPRRIMLITFTNKAARELTERTSVLLGHSPRGLPWAGTFHSVAARLLQRHGAHVDLKPGFTILDRDDAKALMTWASRQVISADEADQFPKPAALLELHSFAANACRKISSVMRKRGLTTGNVKKIKSVLKTYREAKRAQNVVDFDDLLVMWLALMKSPAGDAIRQQFDFVLVDEFQDTNVLQMRILKQLSPTGAGLTVVGDDAQAIYSFRAANVDNILRLDEQVSAPITTITLDRNYRSTRSILRCANAVMKSHVGGIKKRLRATRNDGNKPKIHVVKDSFAEASLVADRVEVMRARGIPLKEQAVLFRASFYSMKVEVELGRRGIPFRKLGGQRFVDAAHVKDVLAVLRWVENPADGASGFRTLRLVRGIGKATADRLLAQVVRVGLLPALSAHRPPSAIADRWRDFTSLMASVSGATTTLTDAVAAIVHWLEASIRDRFENPDERMQELGQLVDLARHGTSRTAFLTDLTLDAGDAPVDKTDVLTLSTIHSVKGLEFEHVQILHVNETLMPSDYADSNREIEEERRLLYVAVTRAKDKLAMFVLRTHHVLGGRATGVRPSPFLTKAVRKRCTITELIGKKLVPLDIDWQPVGNKK